MKLQLLASMVTDFLYHTTVGRSFSVLIPFPAATSVHDWIPTQLQHATYHAFPFTALSTL